MCHMRKNIAVVLVTVILTLFVLEIGLRILITTRGNEEQKVLYLYTREEINKLKARYRGMPFLNYGLSPIREGFNSLGYRGREIEVPKQSGTYRIVALGGSTTFGEYLDSWEKAYPSQLEDVLHTVYGYDHIDIVNAGVPGYTTWESAVNLLLRVQDLEPDMVIIYHGVNDINPRLSDPDFYDGLNLGKGIWLEHDDPLPVSALYRFVMVKLGQNIKVNYSLGEQFSRPDGYRSCGLDVSADIPFCRNLDMTAAAVLEANPPIYFERNIRNMIHMAKGMGIDVLLVTWAYSPHEYAVAGGEFMTYKFRQDAISDHNAILRALAEDEHTLFYDLAETMPDSRPFWIDGLHMTVEGATVMASQLAEYLADTGVFDE